MAGMDSKQVNPPKHSALIGGKYEALECHVFFTSSSILCGGDSQSKGRRPSQRKVISLLVNGSTLFKFSYEVWIKSLYIFQK
jgi:hypothetical protein